MPDEMFFHLYDAYSYEFHIVLRHLNEMPRSLLLLQQILFNGQLKSHTFKVASFIFYWIFFKLRLFQHQVYHL